MAIWDDIVGVGEDIVDAALDLGEDAVDYVEDNVVDPLVDAVSDAAEWAEENLIDPSSDFVSTFYDLLDEAADFAAEKFGEFIEQAQEYWETFAQFAEDAWDAFVSLSEAVWDWVTDKVADAVDWLLHAATTVLDFIIKDAIPYLVNLVMFVVDVIVAICALLILPICALIRNWFGDDEAEVLRGIAEHRPRLMDEFNVSRRPVTAKYAVFSDVHMYTEGDLDFFNNRGNAAIYRHALDWYDKNGFALIENGDVEDFWMRGYASTALMDTVTEQLPWPFYSGAFEEAASRSAMSAHAFNIFANNAEVYSDVRTKFHDRGRYVRLLGNHDDAWEDSDVQEIINLIYPGVVVNDYCTLDDPFTRNGIVVLAHGHQSDIFNMPMCAFAGKALTSVAARLHRLSFGAVNLFGEDRSKWVGKLRDPGLDNELQDINIVKLVSFSEKDLYDDLEDMYGDSRSQPFLVLGHTHNPKDEAGIPLFMFEPEWNWDEYANSGTTGMWESICFGLEIDYPSVKVIAWLHDSAGMITRREFSSVRAGDVYLRAA
jgi:hypothetical protein